MTGEELDALIRAAVTLSGTVGVVYVAVRLAIHYQRDFTNEYAKELKEQAARIDELEERMERASERLQACNESEARMRLALINAGIPIPPKEQP